MHYKDEGYDSVFANYTINNLREDDITVICGNNFICKSGQHCGSNSIHSTNTSSIKKTGTASSNLNERNNSKNKSPQQSPTDQQQQQQMYVDYKNRRIKRKGNTMNLYRDNSSGLIGMGLNNNSMNSNSNTNKNTNKSQRIGNNKFLYEGGNAYNNNVNGISLKKFKLNQNSSNYCNNRSSNMNCNIAIPSYRSHNNSGTISPLSPRNVKFTTELQNLPKIEYGNKHSTKYNGLSYAFDNVNNSLSLRKTKSFVNVFDLNQILKQQKSFSLIAMHS